MTAASTTTKTKIATPTRKHFALTGPSRAFDPRIDAARGDLADIRLSDRIFASHYAAAVLRSVGRRAPLTARVGGEPLSEVLGGEPFEVLELANGHAWGISPVDGAVGFVAIDALGPYAAATHIVTCPAADAPPLGTRLMSEAANATPLAATIPDFGSVAEALVGAPHVPGGRSGAGVDAGGLVFLALSLAGVPAPRFADLQAASLGHTIDPGAPVLRGDLLFTGDGAAIATGADHAVRTGADGVELIPIADLTVTLRRRLP
jgi:hypothetical protein